MVETLPEHEMQDFVHMLEQSIDKNEAFLVEWIVTGGVIMCAILCVAGVSLLSAYDKYQRERATYVMKNGKAVYVKPCGSGDYGYKEIQ